MSERGAQGKARGVGRRDAEITALEQRNAKLSEAVAARDAFLAIAAHELRNPMTPVVGHIQRLRRLVGSGSATMAEVEQGLDRMMWLVDLFLKRANTLLDVSRITSGKLRLDLARVDVTGLIRDVVANLTPAIEFSGSAVTCRLEPDLYAMADRTALEQIADNLIINASKYGAGRPIAVELASEDGWFRLDVRDQGIGMTSENQQRLFAPFERALATQAQSGFGIGLWVVRQLVEAGGGQVTVSSTLGEGSVFSVRLPLGVERS